MRMLFLFHLKSSFPSQDSSCFCLFAHVENNFKIYDVTAWLKNNYKTNIAQYLMN